jgi:hypothetical protein
MTNSKTETTAEPAEPEGGAQGSDDELIQELIAGLVSALDQRYEQHLRSSVMPLAQRIETLAQGFAQLFALMKRQRRDIAALEAMKCLLTSELAAEKSPAEIAELAYAIGGAMDDEGSQSEKSALAAIREATEALEKARRDGSHAQKLEAPGQLARRLMLKRSTEERARAREPPALR